MDEPTLASASTFADTTPVRIGAVGLVVRDLDKMVGFYRDDIGLDVMARDAAHAELGAGGIALLVLDHRAAALPDDRRTAGLFHTAFLMPSRVDLARFVVHLAHRGTAISGVADHQVSEAIYLDDPEGNGVEVYADRPADQWRRDGKAITITTEPLDMNGLLAAADGASRYVQAPAGLRIGHVHLRVGDVGHAEQFFGDVLGLDVTARARGGVFLSYGGYHHHIAANVWFSAGAGRRDPRRAGLAWLRLQATNDAHAAILRQLVAADIDPDDLHDPWGTRIVVAPA